MFTNIDLKTFFLQIVQIHVFVTIWVVGFFNFIVRDAFIVCASMLYLYILFTSSMLQLFSFS